MDAFDNNKYKENDFIKAILSSCVIVSYGFITGIDINTVTVTLAVSDKGKAERVTCTFMSLGNEFFALKLKPEINMRVVVLSPGKAAEGMYESFAQLKQEQGRDFILSNNPSIYSSQFAICFPLTRSIEQALSSLIVDKTTMTAEINHELIAHLSGPVDMTVENDTTIEFLEETDHYRDYFGSLRESFGMVEGIGGAEKPGTYEYEETYGKYSSVTKNYESGFTAVIGKAYEKPFLTSKGALLDSSAPVTVTLGKNAPATIDASAPITINMDTGIPVTLKFGGSAVSVSVDSASGINFTLTGSAPVQILAGTGKLKIGNASGTIALVVNQLLTALESLGTTGGPTAQTVNTATVAALQAVGLLLANIFE